MVCGDGEDQKQRELRLGAWISNQRSRAATLTPERMELLSTIGMSGSGHCCRLSCATRGSTGRCGRARPTGRAGPGSGPA
ncbi:helicase associated domain-containing protein [Streptomyces globosus]